VSLTVLFGSLLSTTAPAGVTIVDDCPGTPVSAEGRDWKTIASWWFQRLARSRESACHGHDAPRWRWTRPICLARGGALTPQPSRRMGSTRPWIPVAFVGVRNARRLWRMPRRPECAWRRMSAQSGGLSRRPA